MYLKAYCGITGFAGKQKEDDRESINKDLKGPILNNIAMCLIKQGKLQRALFYLDLILVGPNGVDATNFKAWKRKIDVLIQLDLLNQAKSALKEAERHAETLQEKTMITNLYRDLANHQGAKEDKFNPNMANAFTKNPPDFTKIQEMMLEYEREHLEKLSNMEWILYPFIKTYRVLSNSIFSCCKKGGDRDFG